MHERKPKPFIGQVIDESGFRVEFSNQGKKPHDNPCPSNPEGKKIPCRWQGCSRETKAMMGLCSEHSTGKFRRQIKHPVDWIGELKAPEPKPFRPMKTGDLTLKAYAPAHSETTELLITWMNKEEARMSIMDRFINEILKKIVGNIPDATSLQSNFETGKGEHPTDVIKKIMTPVDACFPLTSYKDEGIPNIRIRLSESPAELVADIPVRVIAALLTTGFACEEINRGDYWCYKNSGLNPSKSSRASVYMSAVYYFIRRHTNATPKQARMSLRT